MEPLVTIIIPDIAGVTACATTLASLARHTPEQYEVMLLIAESRRGQAPLQVGQHVRTVVVSNPANIPASLNQVLATSTTPFLLLLESGAIVTHAWLTRLLAPFADTTVGLSGPSTNICWNEQQVVPHGAGVRRSLQQIDAYAATNAINHLNQRRNLDTLHSLNDFCYLFKRAVAEQLGGFDEAYGSG